MLPKLFVDAAENDSGVSMTVTRISFGAEKCEHVPAVRVVSCLQKMALKELNAVIGAHEAKTETWDGILGFPGKVPMTTTKISVIVC